MAAPRIICHVVAIATLFASCIDFDFLSDYEDINGIYLEYIGSYDIHGQEIIVNDGIGYVVNEESLLIYDFGNVDSILRLDSYSAHNSINDFAVEGGYAYLATFTGLEIVDLSGPYPSQAGMLWRTFVTDVRIVGDRAYLLSGFNRNILDIINISDRTNPILIDSIVFNNDITQMDADSDFAYVLIIYLTRRDFHIIDVAEPNHPVLACTFSSDTILTQSFTLDGDYLHFAAWDAATWESKIITYTFTDNQTLTRTSEIICPVLFRDPLQIDGFYGLGLFGWWYSYLFELIDHARPYIAEDLPLANQGISGCIKDNYIFILSPLQIIEIKQVTQ